MGNCLCKPRVPDDGLKGSLPPHIPHSTKEDNPPRIAHVRGCGDFLFEEDEIDEIEHAEYIPPAPSPAHL
ncbi:hypothetical protein ACLX1H_008172 [Fusarium chlamydosporum]